MMQKPDWLRLQEGLDNKIARLEQENAELRLQRDELLSALKYLLEEYRREYSFHREPEVRCENVDAVLVAKQAIANAEGKVDE